MTRDVEVKLAEVQHRHRTWEEAGMRVTNSHLDKAFLLKLVRAQKLALDLANERLATDTRALTEIDILLSEAMK